MDNKERFLTVRISEELLEKMRAIAKQHSRSLTGEVRVALQEYAEKHQRGREVTSKG